MARHPRARCARAPLRCGARRLRCAVRVAGARRHGGRPPDRRSRGGARAFRCPGARAASTDRPVRAAARTGGPAWDAADPGGFPRPRRAAHLRLRALRHGMSRPRARCAGRSGYTAR